MKGILKARPSPSMVVAIAAMIVALAGTAYAVKKAPKNSVVTKSIKGSAVTSEKIKDGDVGTSDLANAAVNSGKLADAAVNSGKLADAAVGRSKLASDQQTLWALVSPTGAILKDSGGVTFSGNNGTPGFFYLNFGTPVAGRAIMVSSKYPQDPGGPPTMDTSGFVSAAVCGGANSNAAEGVICNLAGTNDSSHVFVKTSTTTGTGVDPRPFYIAVLPK
jgi:hypothetical protein